MDGVVMTRHVKACLFWRWQILIGAHSQSHEPIGVWRVPATDIFPFCGITIRRKSIVL